MTADETQWSQWRVPPPPPPEPTTLDMREGPRVGGLLLTARISSGRGREISEPRVWASDSVHSITLATCQSPRFKLVP